MSDTTEQGRTQSQWEQEALSLREHAPAGLLFLCVANSARSQLAEAIARQLAPAATLVFSAGSAPSRVNPLASRVLAEIGIDASGQRSKGLAEIPPGAVDAVITLCAEEVCPVWLGHARRWHWGLPDPAAVEGDEEARLAAFRETRDELRRRLSVVFAPAGCGAGCCESPMPDRAELRRQARVIKALANEARLMIVYRLQDGECSAGALSTMVGLDPSTVSKHLSVLRAAGIVDDRREGNMVYYRLLTPCVLSMSACASRVNREREGL